MELGSSINTALEVSTPGWWANIVTVVPRLTAGGAEQVGISGVKPSKNRR